MNTQISREPRMPLSTGLLGVLLAHACPHCGQPNERTGAAFKTLAHYVCGSCGQKVLMTYYDKIRLFEANADREAL
jgi:transposase-like protein